MTAPPAKRHSAEIEGAVLDAALGFDDPVAREDFLEHWFRDNPEGLAKFRRLLEASEQSATFFLEARESRTQVVRDVIDGMPADSGEEGTRANAPLPNLEGPGTPVGPYCLIARIGEGGCGVVYEAEQTVPFRRQVALKIIRLGMDTESVIARFKMERQALAMMEHRNIAAVFDAGATADGRPYFVMELVKGRRITEHCDARKLTPRERLALFIEVCGAIQHAHLKGLIHRDIKPSNILVSSTAAGDTPKVIDFGIAKATTGRPLGATAFTGHDQLLGTPAYMSPEQVDLRGTDIDSRCDVYSLGVLLYELLTGRTPFDGEELANCGILQLQRILLEQEPPRPSRALTMAADSLPGIAADRSMDPARLVDFVTGDLDAIVMKAMEKDRTRRYQTVNSLEADVQRFLANQPVEASKPGHLYTFRKFVRRNRVACLSGAAVAISLVAGLAVSTWLYVRESRAIAERSRLVKEAEAHEAEKLIFRKQAMEREIFSRLTFLINEGREAEAEEMLRDNPVENIESRREGVTIFRALAHWSGQKQQPEQTLAYFRQLDQANRNSDPVNVIEGRDLMPLAPLVLTIEGDDAYEHLRSRVLMNYLPVQSTRSAHQVLKMCLLTPADPSMLETLGDVAKVCESHVPGPNGIRPNADWEAFSMALYHLRMQDHEQSLEWRNRFAALPKVSRVCATAARAVAAMASYHLGKHEQARIELARAKVDSDNSAIPADYKNTWWDWIIARILVHEAEALMGPIEAED
ncbi:serine/threonine protein kinase [Luteolibacter flavescens]|uniref:Serine/threonine protein kinase n=1 Tax=Luteolibacter flavescens TaxID=1859460 RepID=A0ABT3FNV4_9BACT|nr:serine/threonine-protein kinase [Luteolibacter flavescens]MCW1885249.1 serine/threonine protein kinase [Luteolibacter flavescens]